MESFNVLYRTLVGQTLLPVCSEALGSNSRTGKNAGLLIKKGQEKIS